MAKYVKKCGIEFVLDMDEACEYLGMSKNYLYKLTSRKEIAHYKVRRRIMFKRETLDNFMLAREVPATSPIPPKSGVKVPTGVISTNNTEPTAAAEDAAATEEDGAQTAK